MENNYIKSAIRQFEYYKSLADKTFLQLSDEELFWRPNEESNSIATLIKHLSGNMLSRWTDFLTSDGEKEWRDRDSEFENDIESRDTILAKWDKGWNCLFSGIHALTAEDLERIIYIRNEGHTVTEAINRQLAHYPYHIGQIVFLGKIMCNEQWKSLSIPRGNSKTYNGEKFSQPKKRQHFTDEFLNPPKDKE